MYASWKVAPLLPITVIAIERQHIGLGIVRENLSESTYTK